jgi:bacteriocin-like protein
MYQITNEELKQIYGGIGIWAALGIAGFIVFLIGVVDGFVRPLSCRK